MQREREREANPRLRQKRRRKVCFFCVNKTLPEYKDFEGLRRYISDRGKILPRRSSGCCARHQRRLAQAIKRGRLLGRLPYKID